MKKETIELVKKMVEDGNLPQEVAIKYCPELEENEDEKIRKHLIKIFKAYQNPTYHSNPNNWEGLEISSILAWLKKIGELISTEWGEEDKDAIDNIISILDDEQNNYQTLSSDYNRIEKLKNKLKSFKPQKPLTNEEIEQAKKEYRNVALSKVDDIPEELTYDDGWDDAISYMKKSLRSH